LNSLIYTWTTFLTSKVLAEIFSFFLLLTVKTDFFDRYLSVTKSYFCLEKHYIPAKHSSKAHVSSSVLYAGCVPHVRVVALITAQQRDMQTHKAFLAGRKFLLEESAIAGVCCTAEQPAWDVCSR